MNNQLTNSVKKRELALSSHLRQYTYQLRTKKLIVHSSGWLCIDLLMKGKQPVAAPARCNVPNLLGPISPPNRSMTALEFVYRLKSESAHTVKKNHSADTRQIPICRRNRHHYVKQNVRLEQWADSGWIKRPSAFDRTVRKFLLLDALVAGPKELPVSYRYGLQ